MTSARLAPTGRFIDGLDQLDIQRFSGPGTYTWTKPAQTRSLDVYIFPVGCPGGSGRNNGPIGTTNAAGGAGGGSAGPRIFRDLDPSLFGSTVAVVIGAASVGGAAVATPTTNGNAGVAGGATSFGFISALAGAGASGGTVGGGSSASLGGFQDYLIFSGIGGGNGSTGVGNSGSSNQILQSPGAGGGGGIPIAGTPNNGGASGVSVPFPVAIPGGLAAGPKDGNAGPSILDGLIPGGAGSGGASSSDGTAGGAGGAGGFPSGPGGGGGASAGGGPSGPGGPGGGALVVVIAHIGD